MGLFSDCVCTGWNNDSLQFIPQWLQCPPAGHTCQLSCFWTLPSLPQLRWDQLQEAFYLNRCSFCWIHFYWPRCRRASQPGRSPCQKESYKHLGTDGLWAVTSSVGTAPAGKRSLPIVEGSSSPRVHHGTPQTPASLSERCSSEVSEGAWIFQP